MRLGERRLGTRHEYRHVVRRRQRRDLRRLRTYVAGHRLRERVPAPDRLGQTLRPRREQRTGRQDPELPRRGPFPARLFLLDRPRRVRRRAVHDRDLALRRRCEPQTGLAQGCLRLLHLGADRPGFGRKRDACRTLELPACRQGCGQRPAGPHVPQCRGLCRHPDVDGGQIRLRSDLRHGLLALPGVFRPLPRRQRRERRRPEGDHLRRGIRRRADAVLRRHVVPDAGSHRRHRRDGRTEDQRREQRLGRHPRTLRIRAEIFQRPQRGLHHGRIYGQ